MPELAGGEQSNNSSQHNRRERPSFTAPADLSQSSLSPELSDTLPAEAAKLFRENRAHILDLLSDFEILRGYQVKEILTLAKGLNKPEAAAPCPDSVFGVMARDASDPNITKFKALNEGVDGFQTGPRIDAITLSGSCPGMTFNQLISAIKAFGIDAVGVVAPDGRAERHYVWIIFFKDDRAAE